MSKIDKKGGLSSKTANIDSKIELFIHFTIKFNSKYYSLSIFFRIIQFKKLIQKSLFVLIQFNKIFIQLENLGTIWLAARVEVDKRADELGLLDSQQVAAMLDSGGLISYTLSAICYPRSWWSYILSHIR